MVRAAAVSPLLLGPLPVALVIRSNQGHGDTGPGPQPRLTRAGKLCGNEILI